MWRRSSTFLEIEAIRRTPVGKLPYGLQKRVELGRALALEPDLLLLDEPMAGMNLEEKEDMSRFILDVNQQFGTTIALIEHDMGVVMDLADRVVVLDYGKKIADGTPARSPGEPGRHRRLSRRAALMETGALIAGGGRGWRRMRRTLMLAAGILLAARAALVAGGHRGGADRVGARRHLARSYWARETRVAQ